MKHNTVMLVVWFGALCLNGFAAGGWMWHLAHNTGNVYVVCLMLVLAAVVMVISSFAIQDLFDQRRMIRALHIRDQIVDTLKSRGNDAQG